MTTTEPVIVTVNAGGVAEINTTNNPAHVILIDYAECNENIEYALEMVQRILDSQLSYERQTQYIKQILYRH